jgi:HK97 family phage major capsid protein/HK97 family phage prohead protease
MSEHLEIKAEVSIDDAGTVTGIAWPFGSPDTYGDLIEPTAFRFAAKVPMMLEHDQGKIVGQWETMTVTDSGLEVKGSLFVDSAAPARTTRQQLRRGAMSGLSIGYRLHEYKARPEGGRVLTDLTITEISICRSPVHPSARVTEVKSINEESPMENEELKNEPELKADPVISADELKALKSRLDKVEAKANRPLSANNNQPLAENDNGQEEKKAFGVYLRKGIELASDNERKALTVSTAANGGYLAPQEFGNELIKLLREMSPLRAYADIVNISAQSIVYPRRLTSTAAAWVSEIANRTESGMTFEQVTLTPAELATYVDVSNQLIADNAYNLETELLADIAESFSKAEGLAFVKGTGTGQPKGLLTATGITEVKTGVAAAFPASNPADVLIGMYHKIPTTHARNAVWMMNRNTLSVVRQWKDTTGRYLVSDPVNGGASTIFGRDVVEMPDMDDIAAGLYPIIFGDPKGYRIADRLDIDFLRDPYTVKLQGITRFHAWKRVGADVTHPDRFVKLKVSA